MADRNNWLVKTTGDNFIASNLWGYGLQIDNEDCNYALINLRNGECIGFYENLDGIKDDFEVISIEEYRG